MSTPEEEMGEFLGKITGVPFNRDWIERVRQADRDAEEAWEEVRKADMHSLHMAHVSAQAMVAIAAELRAQRIARRPGAGQ